VSSAQRRDPKKWNAAKAKAKAKMGGKWSARAAQLAVSYYKKDGGGYRGPKKASNSLSKWTRQDWKTRDGKPAKRKNKKGETVTARYLPKKAWSKLSKSEARATDSKKRAASKKGKQFVSNTKKAKRAGKSARR